MNKDYGIAELCEIYHRMDIEDQEKMVQAVTKLFCVQNTPEYKQVTPKVHCSGSYRFTGIKSYFLTGFIFLFTTFVIWINLKNPVMAADDINLQATIRIIITTLIGIFCIVTGYVWFMRWKFTVRWMLLAIGAGILCINPDIITDIFGFALITLIVAVQVIQGKREKATVA